MKGVGGISGTTLTSLRSFPILKFSVDMTFKWFDINRTYFHSYKSLVLNSNRKVPHDSNSVIHKLLLITYEVGYSKRLRKLLFHWKMLLPLCQ